MGSKVNAQQAPVQWPKEITKIKLSQAEPLCFICGFSQWSQVLLHKTEKLSLGHLEPPIGHQFDLDKKRLYYF